MDANDGTDDAERTGRVPSRAFRIEHRVDDNAGVVLARVRDVFPHHDTLTPYVSHLLRAGGADPVRGEVVLIDEATEQVLARRSLSRGLAPRRIPRAGRSS